MVEDLEDICKYYCDNSTDHNDFEKILNAIDLGGGQTTDIAGVIRELHKAGFRIIKVSQ